MHGTMISNLLNISGDVHHIFPKQYLKKNGINSKGKYNQIANFKYLDTQVNKAISDDAPAAYFEKAISQCNTKNPVIGNITDLGSLYHNLAENAIPSAIINMTVADYDEFLGKRRLLMAKLIEEYYKNL